MISYKLLIPVMLLLLVFAGFIYAGRDNAPTPEPVTKAVKIPAVHP